MMGVAVSSVLIHNADKLVKQAINEVQHEEGYGSNKINNDNK